MAQQAETGGAPAQIDRDDPGGDHQQRDRGDVDTQQVDLDEPHAGVPASK
jgi:hypothetical protein